MKNFRGSALAAGVGTTESAPHELLGSSLRFYLVFKHRNFYEVSSVKIPLDCEYAVMRGDSLNAS